MSSPKALFLAAVAAGGLLGVAPARAEGNCPPGYYPAGGIGFVGCAPIPGYGADYGYGGYSDYDASDYDPMGADGLASLFGFIADAFASPAAPKSEPQQPPPMPTLPPGVSSVYQSEHGVWLMFAVDGACSAVFGQGMTSLTFSGPTGSRPGAITFMGAEIAKPFEPTEVQLTILADGKPAKVRALHMPSGMHGVIIVPTVIEDTLRSIGDSEVIELELAGRSVYKTHTYGAHAARDAMLQCLG